jgi:acyl carrier protein
MDFDILLQKIIDLAREQFNVEQDINESTTAAEVSTWNSLSHVVFITSIERSFDIKFDLLQMIGMKSIGDIARASHKIIQ